MVDDESEMKRFLLFSGERYYPEGGWEDFGGSFDSLEDAIAAFSEGSGDWAHIVDIEDESIVWWENRK